MLYVAIKRFVVCSFVDDSDDDGKLTNNLHITYNIANIVWLFSTK